VLKNKPISHPFIFIAGEQSADVIEKEEKKRKAQQEAFQKQMMMEVRKRH
jgi:hypothetical protein